MSLRNVILVVKDLAQTKAFFVDALRLKLKYENENIMEFDTGSVPLILKVGIEFHQFVLKANKDISYVCIIL